ncbi:MAG: FtsQ-type POTRA domain-containing protein [Desulfobacter sp.]|nr:MAG: FtsQ-type POTRA domain-containing protein [Desulfobacter sp.]
MATKSIKQNRYKPAPGSDRQQKANSAQDKRMIFKGTLLVIMILFMTVTYVFLHDIVVQSPLFTVKSVDMSGESRASKTELIARAGLDQPVNLFSLCPKLIEKKLCAHPWVAKVKVERKLFSRVKISIKEQEPLAIVAIENLADIVINTQGVPFKEYDPENDHLKMLPVISGMDLSLSNNTYLFEGQIFNSIMDLLQTQKTDQIKSIHGDENRGILIKTLDIYNKKIYIENNNENKEGNEALIPIKLGFDQFDKKLARARKISRYMAANFLSKTILAMDLFDIEKIFVKTEDALHNTLEKGV